MQAVAKVRPLTSHSVKHVALSSPSQVYHVRSAEQVDRFVMQIQTIGGE